MINVQCIPFLQKYKNISNSLCDINIISCDECKELNFIEFDHGDNHNINNSQFVPVKCGNKSCKGIIVHRPTSSQAIKTIPIRLAVGDEYKIIDYIFIKGRHVYDDDDNANGCKYIVHWDCITMQMEIKCSNQQNLITNPWYNQSLAESSAKHFRIAPMVLPCAEPMKMRTATNTNRTNVLIEKSIDLRKGSVKRKEIIAIYMQQTLDHMRKLRMYYELNDIVYHKMPRGMNVDDIDDEKDVEAINDENGME